MPPHPPRYLSNTSPTSIARFPLSLSLSLSPPRAGSDSFKTFNTTEWQAGNWLNGWNGEFHFYTGAPSNRSRNLFVENGTLFLQPDLTANYRPGGGDPLGWTKVLGCNRTNASTAALPSCPDPSAHPSLVIDADKGTGRCSVPWDSSKCNVTAGVCIKKDSKCAAYTTLPPVTSSSLRTARAFKFGRMEVRARLPRGDWLWPAIWLLPQNSVYGGWPTSGEIDLMESRGNAPGSCGPGQGKGSLSTAAAVRGTLAQRHSKTCAWCACCSAWDERRNDLFSLCPDDRLTPPPLRSFLRSPSLLSISSAPSSLSPLSSSFSRPPCTDKGGPRSAPRCTLGPTPEATTGSCIPTPKNRR